MSKRTTIMSLLLVVGLVLADLTDLQALSVGDIVVQSRRGEPFLAEVPLKLTPPDRQRGVVVMLGDHEEYRFEEVARTEVIDRLRAIWHPGARDFIRVTSKVPVQMPAFEIVLLVQSGRITIVKTYRVTLPAPPAPPPVATRFAASPAAKPAPITPGSGPAPTASEPAPPASPSAPKGSRTAVARARQPAAPAASKTTQATSSPSLPAWLQRLPKRYGAIKQGETLHGVVVALGPPRSEVWPTVVRIWQANKEQFSGGNLHGLRSGAYLTIPADLATTLASLNLQQARKIVAEQWEAWQTLRRAASSRQRLAPPRQKPAVLTEKPVVSSPKPEPIVAAVPRSDAQLDSPPPTVVLPAEPVARAPAITDLHSLLQGLERLLARQLTEPDPAEVRTSFVRATELQTALQGLEERLSQRLQDSLQQMQVSQQALQMAHQASVTQPTRLAQLFPANSMAVILVVENALLILLASGLLWRRVRSRA
ncbi:hypothetical protein NKDENANG_01928 [Candidatus Entotheonellaceae bacterium PAL068K]